jgi:hypothetical protein
MLQWRKICSIQAEASCILCENTFDTHDIKFRIFQRFLSVQMELYLSKNSSWYRTPVLLAGVSQTAIGVWLYICITRHTLAAGYYP